MSIHPQKMRTQSAAEEHSHRKADLVYKGRIRVQMQSSVVRIPSRVPSSVAAHSMASSSACPCAHVPLSHADSMCMFLSTDANEHVLDRKRERVRDRDRERIKEK